MPRPKALGKVCHLPEVNLFGPLVSNPHKREIVNLSIEEYEAIRIIDLMQLSQEEAAELMDLSRQTLQRIYYSAKQKLAESIVFGRILKIEGGNFKLCDVDIDCQNCKHCPCSKKNKDLKLKEQV
ncbi:MAG: DUF134 domain-containing protein [Acholeplasmataceae bacterium]